MKQRKKRWRDRERGQADRQTFGERERDREKGRESTKERERERNERSRARERDREKVCHHSRETHRKCAAERIERHREKKDRQTGTERERMDAPLKTFPRMFFATLTPLRGSRPCASVSFTAMEYSNTASKRNAANLSPIA